MENNSEQMWEYLVIRVIPGNDGFVRIDVRSEEDYSNLDTGKFNDQLTKLGQKGWEMTGAGGNYLYFKRPFTGRTIY